MIDFSLRDLEIIIEKRKKIDSNKSYTAKLFNGPIEKVIKKVGEEHAELIYAINQNDKKKLIHEFADLLYHLVVLSKILNISVNEIMDELLSRTKISGLVEKENRKK